MEPENIADKKAPASVTSVGRIQATLCAWLIAISVVTGVIVDIAAHAEPIAKWLENSQIAEARQNPHFYYRYTRAFLDEGDRLLLEDLPAADFARGGVYYFGSSTMMYSFKQWEVPDKLVKVMGNYSTGGMNHLQQRQFIRYLGDHLGFFARGKGETMVVVGLSFINAHDDPMYFPQLLSRSGLWSYTSQAGIVPARIGPVQAVFLAEKARCRSMLNRLVAGPPTLPWEPPDSEKYNTEIDAILGPDWRAAMDHQNHELSGLFDDLRSRGASVIAVILPYGSWNNHRPYQKLFRDQVEAICKEKAVELVDCGTLLSDDEFFDRAHCNAAGADKIHRLLFQIGLDHLAKVGLH